MLTPADKVYTGGNDIIQILVTTRCDLRCSNCTQLIGFRKDNAFMSLVCFEAAVQSLEDWPGVVALFGGNPCVHPQFPELCRILSQYIPEGRRGLWTNNLFKHGRIASETFARGRLNLNAHGDPKAFDEMNRWFPGQVIPETRERPSMHAAILTSYQDFGISYLEWSLMRERCDINQKWSAAVMERDGRPYAYFCEVAGALDGIRGQNHGIPAVPGWWRYAMQEYTDQVRSCCDAGCGVPLRLRGHQDAEEIYDISPVWAFVRDEHPSKVTVLHETIPAARCTAADDYVRRWSE